MRCIVFSILLFSINISSCHKNEEINLTSYDGYALIFGYTHYPSTLYQFYPLLRKEVEQFIESDYNKFPNERIFVNFHIGQSYMTRISNGYTLNKAHFNLGCRVKDLDAYEYVFLAKIKYRNYQAYLVSNENVGNVNLNECKAYIIDKTDSSNLDIYPINSILDIDSISYSK